jgi:hypothetical protein
MERYKGPAWDAPRMLGGGTNRPPSAITPHRAPMSWYGWRLPDGVAQAFAGFESRLPVGWQPHLLARTWVPPFASGAGSHPERAESHQGDLVTLTQRLLHTAADRV